MPPPGAQELSHTRVRLLEEKTSNLNQKIELLESNIVKGNKKKNEVLREFDNDLLEIKRELAGVKQKVDLIIRELKLTAGKDELNTVKRYLDLWDLTRFVTRDEMERLLRKDL